MKKTIRLCRTLYLAALCLIMGLQWLDFLGMVTLPFMQGLVNRACLITAALSLGVLQWQKWHRTVYVLGGIMLWMIICCLLQVPSTLNDEISRFTLYHMAYIFFACYPAALILERDDGLRFLKTLTAVWVMLCTLLSLLGLWTALSSSVIMNLRRDMFMGIAADTRRLYLFRYATNSASVISVAILLSVMMALSCKKAAGKLVYILCAIAMVPALSLTDGRMGTLILGAGLGALAFLALWHHLKAGKLLRSAAALSAMLILMAACWAGMPRCMELLNRIPVPEKQTVIEWSILPSASAEGENAEADPADSVIAEHRDLTGSDFLAGREVVWRAALDLLKEEPHIFFTGASPALAMQKVNAHVSTGRAFIHVHNLYLQMMLEGGLPMLVPIFIFILFYMAAALRIMFRWQLPMWQRFIPVIPIMVWAGEMLDCMTWLSYTSPTTNILYLLMGFTILLDKTAKKAAEAAA